MKETHGTQEANVAPPVRVGHSDGRQELVTGSVLTVSTVSVVENLSVTSSHLGVRLHPLNALLSCGRVEGLELILLAANLDTSESIRDEGIDEVGERREMVPKRVEKLVSNRISKKVGGKSEEVKEMMLTSNCARSMGAVQQVVRHR
jgi:hypothetical protein